MKYILSCWLFSLLMLSCEEAREAEASIDAEDFFFSLEKFFEAEEERLQALGRGLDKTIRINDREENRTIAEIDYQREFSMFRKADINRPAWRDKYRADSLRTDDRLQTITYTSLDPELKTQEVIIRLTAAGEVDDITIGSKTETALAGNQSVMRYDPDVGYRIETIQKNRTAETMSIDINAKFVIPQ